MNLIPTAVKENFCTFGFLPVLRTDLEKQSSFAVFDRNFKLIRQFDYKEEMWSFAAIWILWADSLLGEPYPPSAYKNEMNRLTKDMYRLLNKYSD